MRLVLVNERAEGHAALPVGGEIRDRRRIDVAVARRLLARPEEQSLLARSVLVADSLRLDSKRSEKWRKETKITKKIVSHGVLTVGLDDNTAPSFACFICLQLRTLMA